MNDGYYRCLRSFDEFKEGRVYSAAIYGDVVSIIWIRENEDYSRSQTVSLSLFQTAFAYEPDGMTVRIQQRIEDTFGEFTDVPQIEDISRLSVSGSSELITASSMQRISENREQVERFYELSEAQCKAIEAVTSEMRSQIRNKMALMQQTMKQMNAILSGFNLYLGVGEEVRIINDIGERAPADDPIHVRQTILYADEECALNTEDGEDGIDYTKISLFFEWLKQPKRRDQIVPESKCIVAFQTRRTDKRYEEKFEKLVGDKMNNAIFFIVRNGERLYAIYPEMKRGNERLLFPTQEEMTKVFEEAELCGDDGRPVSPNATIWGRAVKKAKDMQQHLLATIMFIQGVIDRSDILHPLPGTKINVASPDPKCFRVIRDGENVLDDGRCSFADWQKRANANIRLGSRIIVDIPKAYRHEDVAYPKRRISNVKSNVLIVDQFNPGNSQYRAAKFSAKFIGSSYSFKLDRERETSNRVEFHAGSNFVLEIDNVSEEDIDYYMNCRLHRDSYLDWMPLLKTLKKFKAEERALEEACVQLIAQELAKIMEKTVDDIDMVALGNIVQWWKYKNQIRRPITIDETKAVKMVMHQYIGRERRLMEMALRPRGEGSLVVDHLVAQGNTSELGALLYVGYTGKDYVGLYATPTHTKSSCVVEVRAKVSSRTAGINIERVDEKWRVVAWRHVTWANVWNSPAWDMFDHWAEDRRAIMPYDEKAIVDHMLHVAKRMTHEPVHSDWTNHNHDPEIGNHLYDGHDELYGQYHGERYYRSQQNCYYPLMCRLDGNTVSGWVVVSTAQFDRNYPLSKPHCPPKIRRIDFQVWKNHLSELQFGIARIEQPSEYWPQDSEQVQHRFRTTLAPDKNTIWEDQDAIKAWEEDYRRYRGWLEAIDESPYNRVCEYFNAIKVNKIVEAARIEHEKRNGSRIAWKKIEHDLRYRHKGSSYSLGADATQAIKIALDEGTLSPNETLGELIKRTLPDKEPSEPKDFFEYIINERCPDLSIPEEPEPNDAPKPDEESVSDLLLIEDGHEDSTDSE